MQKAYQTPQGYLHSNYRVDEEQHCNQQNDVRQRLQSTNSITALHVINYKLMATRKNGS